VLGEVKFLASELPSRKGEHCSDAASHGRNIEEVEIKRRISAYLPWKKRTEESRRSSPLSTKSIVFFSFPLEILIRKSLDRPNVIPTDSLNVVLTRLAQKEMRSTSTETTIPTTAPFEGARVSFSLGIGAPKRRLRGTSLPTLFLPALQPIKCTERVLVPHHTPHISFQYRLSSNAIHLYLSSDSATQLPHIASLYLTEIS
jgi:hypothetical protein